MTARDEVFEGSCLCGVVRYRIAGEPGEMWHCHCTDCRKSHGAVFATSVQVDRRNFTLLGGEDLLVTYEAMTGTRRSFCGRCGSNISGTITSEPELVYVTAATLDTRFEGTPATHIFVRSKVPWFEIRDGLPQHATYTGDSE